MSNLYAKIINKFDDLDKYLSSFIFKYTIIRYLV